jgi:hypothetical protein
MRCCNLAAWRAGRAGSPSHRPGAGSLRGTSGGLTASMAVHGVGSVVANLERKASNEFARHVPRDGIEFVIPITKQSRNHPVMSDGDVDVGDEVDVGFARSS